MSPRWTLLVLGLSGAAGAQVPVERTELGGAIVGRVCRDVAEDGQCDADDPGIGGARLVLETGQTAIADAAGRFHFAVVPARIADTFVGGRLQQGRHRVVLDTRGLSPGERPWRAAQTVEVPLAAMVTVSFPVRPAPRTTSELKLAPEAQAPAGVVDLARRRIRFLLAGKGSVGDRISVQGKPAEVDAAGLYRAWVELTPGANEVPIAVETPSGAVRLFTQRVDVVERRGGLLVIPRELRATASAQLPGGDDQAASTGRTSIRFESAPGTRIRHPGGEVEVGPQGVAEIPVELRAGRNEIPVEIAPEGQPARPQTLAIPAAPRPLLAGLLDLEATWSPSLGGLRLFGRGAAHGEYRLGPFELAGELELRDTDFTRQTLENPVVLALPRLPERLERVIDPERAPLTFGDDAVELSPNAAESRLRLELRHDTLGAVGVGTHRVALRQGEVGRFERMLFGPYLRVDAPISEAVSLSARGYYAPAAVDPTRPLVTLPAHDELRATGGSLFYLSHPVIAEGSEHVTVELRDGRTALPLGERHLVRGRDYEIEYTQGRILLAKPLSFFEGESVLQSAPLEAGVEPTLVVSYERVVLGPSPLQTAGGSVAAQLGPVRVGAGAVDLSGRYRMAQATAQGSALGFSLHGEVALSSGDALGAEGLGWSDDGGLSFRRSQGVVDGGLAYGLRLRGPGLSPEGMIDAAWRVRSAGFSDIAHRDVRDHNQVSLRVRQPLGPVRVGALVDLLRGSDPREGFSELAYAARHLGASVAWDAGDFEAGVEGEDLELSAATSLSDPTERTGGRTAVGAYARYQLFSWLALKAAHRQVLARRGEGLGAFDDTFSHAGVDLSADRSLDLGLRAGWGPSLGPRAWFEATHHSGRNAWYGGYSVDVDGPDFGEGRAVSGARTQVGQGASVFVEDVAAHDTAAVRLSRAVGFTRALGFGLDVSARYERGSRVAAAAPDLQFDGRTVVRDAGGLSASWLLERARLYARAEVRRDDVAGAAPLERLQALFSGAAEYELTDSLRLAGRLNFAHTRENAVMAARFLEATAVAVWRIDPATVLLRYSARRELSPGLRKSFGERATQTVSLLPSFRLGDRFQLASGVHAAWNSEGENRSLVLSGSLRPSVRVVGGLELAAEVAARTLSGEGEEWAALRGEAGYRFDERIMLAAGYTFFGFTGSGVPGSLDERRDRLYVRAELAY